MAKLKDSGIEWLGGIPNHWGVKANKYVMSKYKELCPIYHGEDILSLTMNGVIIRDLEAGGKMPTSFDGYQRLYPNNLLMCLFDYDVTPRCIGLIKNKGLSSPAYSQFIMKSGNSSRYYYYYYLMLDNTKELLHLAKNLRHSFTEDQLGAVKVPVPPLEEQNRIADFLDEKCTEIDDISNKIQEQINTLEEYKKSVITEVVTKGLNPNVEMKDSGIDYIGNIPQTWNIKRLKYILCERNERSKIGDEKLLSVSQYKGVIPSEELSQRTMQASSLIGYKKVYKDDLVFNKLNPGLARFGASSYNGITSPDFSVYIVDKCCHSKFLQYVLKSNSYVTKIKSMSIGVGDGFTRLYTPQLYDFYIAIPNRKIIDEIIMYIDQFLFDLNNVIEDKQQQLSTLEEYKKSLIYEYVTGKKEVA